MKPKKKKIYKVSDSDLKELFNAHEDEDFIKVKPKKKHKKSCLT